MRLGTCSRRTPLWAAMKGAWWGASPGLRVVTVLVLLLLGILLATIIAGIRAATR